MNSRASVIRTRRVERRRSLAVPKFDLSALIVIIVIFAGGCMPSGELKKAHKLVQRGDRAGADRIYFKLMRSDAPGWWTFLPVFRSLGVRAASECMDSRLEAMGSQSLEDQISLLSEVVPELLTTVARNDRETGFKNKTAHYLLEIAGRRLKVNDIAGARRDIESSIAVSKELPQAYHLKGLIEWYEDQHNKAQECFLKALKIDGDFLASRIALLNLQAQLEPESLKKND